MARNDLQVLAHAAVAHAQFETLHPFPDGNGRTGRALVHAILRAKSLTRNVTVPVSAGLLVDVDAYFASLTAYRDGHPEEIISRFASATFHALGNGRQLVSELRDLRQDWQSRITARRDAGVWRVADLLIRQPAINASLLAKELDVAPANVYRLIEPLVNAGVLVESTDRRRGRTWRSPEVLHALDAFAARAGRRARSS
jgi:Fic family protein